MMAAIGDFGLSRALAFGQVRAARSFQRRLVQAAVTCLRHTAASKVLDALLALFPSLLRLAQRQSGTLPALHVDESMHTPT